MKFKDNLLALVLSGVTVTGVVAISSAAYTVSAISQQNEALTQIATAVEKSIENSRNVSPQEFEASVVRSLQTLKEREQTEKRDALFAQYENAEEQWDGEAWLYGNPEARFTLVEYADTECIYCKRFHDTPKEIVDASNGNVNWEYQHLTVLGDTSVKQAQAAECVGDQLGNQGFWVYLSEIYTHTGSNGQGAGDLRARAADVGADVAAYDECVKSGRFLAEIASSTQTAKAQGISGTPATLLVDNQTGQSQLLGGAQPTEAFVQVMRQMLGQSATK